MCQEAVLVSEWTVRINGVDQISVKPGESVEIGRKPLRPLADDGTTRLDVVDRTKSMSKRHVLFAVKENGVAAVRDLDSTNGSYVVRDNGDLLRLPVNADFLLPTSPMRMQFGDVPADFIRVDDPDDTADQPVPDLVGYAVHEAPQEPDAADMSVDDILDLRAGEPTAMFSADSVRRKVDDINLDGLNVVQPLAKAEEPASPRDLFEDAMAQQSSGGDDAAAEESKNDQAGAAETAGAGRESSGVTPAVNPVLAVVPVDVIAHPVSRTVAAAAEPSAADHAAPQGEQEDVTVAVPECSAQAEQTPESAQPQADEPQQDTEAQQAVDSPQDAEPQAAAETPQTTEIQPAADSQPADDARFQANQVSTDDSASDALDATGTYTPAFEPGSVFERVAKGELKAQEPVVEIDGLTSDDAKTTQDFSIQFDIARHPELLAYLAMNPYLYDDMYAWLSARGESDIDKALAHNKGYQEYRKAVGK